MADNRRFGWRKDKFNPEATYFRPKIMRTVPDLVSYQDKCPSVRDQGKVGSCTGFGIGGMAFVVTKIGHFSGEIGNFFGEVFSPTWLYNGARFMEGTLDQDTGAWPEDVLKWALGNGLLFEHFWPYNPHTLDKTAPGTTRMAQAIKYPDFAYYRVDNGADGIIAALAEGHPVAIGSPWPQPWMSCPSGLLPTPDATTPCVGGHETFLYGYDKIANLFFGQNSWGTDWGASGRYKMPFASLAWFKANGGYDAHYISMSDSGIPQPEPKGCLPAWFPFKKK
jgi:hypothetical protein